MSWDAMLAAEECDQYGHCQSCHREEYEECCQCGQPLDFSTIHADGSHYA